MCAYLLLVVGASERERKRERQRDRERVKGSKREIESERENKRERERERERKRTREREKNEKIEREGEGGRDASIAHSRAPTLRGQALQQFAQALGDLVELGHTRVGEGHVDAATTPPALVLGIVRGRRLFLALLVPRHIISCGDLRSLKKKIKSAFVTTCLDTHTQAFRV